MANRKRPIVLRCPVTAEERALIEQKMAQLQTKRIGAYLRKMAIDGYIIQVDTTDIKEMTRALSAIGRNINQIAKRVNAGDGAYKADMREIQERLDEIWQLLRLVIQCVADYEDAFRRALGAKRSEEAKKELSANLLYDVMNGKAA